VFILADTTELTFLFRLALPLSCMVGAILIIYVDTFVLDSPELFSWRGHTLYVLDIQRLAWSEIFVFSCLGIKDLLMDPLRENFHIIEENEVRGSDYQSIGCSLVWTDLSLLITSLVYSTAYLSNAPFIYQAIPGFLFMAFGIVFLRGVKMKCSYFFNYRPLILIISSCIILCCDIFRVVADPSPTADIVWHAKNILLTVLYVFCVFMAVLSDFHTKPTVYFRIVIPVCLMVSTAWNIYRTIFEFKDHKLVTISDHTLGVNQIARSAYIQVFFLLLAFLISMVTNRSLSKFFLIPRRVERKRYLNYLHGFHKAKCETLLPMINHNGQHRLIN